MDHVPISLFLWAVGDRLGIRINRKASTIPLGLFEGAALGPNQGERFGFRPGVWAGRGNGDIRFHSTNRA